MKNNVLQDIRQFLNCNHLDAMLFTSKQNRYWATEFLNSSGYYYVDQTHAWLFVDRRYQTDIKGKTRNCEVVIIKDIFPEINAYLKPLKIKNLGVEADYLTYNFIELMKKELAVEEIVPTSVRKLRMVKSAEEIQNLQRAAQIGDESLIEVCKNFKIGKTENEIENELFQCFIQKGADKVFPRVVLTSGIRGALPHGKPTNKKIQQGELVTIDFGCLYQGYCSDMTRTIAVGEVDPELRKIYQIVQKAQQAGIDTVKPGMKCSEIHQIVWEVINQAGYAPYFLHQTGHGIGLEVHEPPRIADYDDEILQPGMVFTIEPGIYLENVGGVRIEDMILVTENGGQSLTQINKNLTNILERKLSFD